MRFEATASQPSSQTAQPVQRDGDKERRKEGKRKKEKGSKVWMDASLIGRKATETSKLLSLQRKRTEEEDQQLA